MFTNLRVCHIGFNFFPGQGLTIFFEFTRHQARQGLDVSVVAPGRHDEPADEVVEAVHVHRIHIDSIGRYSLGRLIFLWKAARWLRSQEFDLIHVYAFVGAGVLPWLSRLNRPVWLYDCQTSAIKPPLLTLQNLLIRFESWSYDTVTVLSEGIRNIVFGTSAKVEAIIPLGADFDHFRPREGQPELRMRYGISDDAPVLTYCGTLDRNRCLDRMVSAFAQVAALFPKPTLLVIGEGSALEDLKQQARALDLTDRIVFTGFVPYSEIPAHLSITTIALAYIVMTPCFEHQPPTKTIEYLAQGLPVIATDTNGNRVFIRDSFNGLLCSDSADALGGAITELLANPARRARLAANARESVRAFDWSNIVCDRVIPVYREILHRCKR
jgi:glycosyltransferase involved in cell wall biosynthesis